MSIPSKLLATLLLAAILLATGYWLGHRAATPPRENTAPAPAVVQADDAGRRTGYESGKTATQGGGQQGGQEKGKRQAGFHVSQLQAEERRCHRTSSGW